MKSTLLFDFNISLKFALCSTRRFFFFCFLFSLLFHLSSFNLMGNDSLDKVVISYFEHLRGKKESIYVVDAF